MKALKFTCLKHTGENAILFVFCFFFCFFVLMQGLPVHFETRMGLSFSNAPAPFLAEYI